MTTIVERSYSRMVSRTSTPLIPGIEISSITISGFSSRNFSTASSPFDAWPHTSTPCASVSDRSTSLRISSQSSTIKTLILSLKSIVPFTYAVCDRRRLTTISRIMILLSFFVRQGLLLSDRDVDVRRQLEDVGGWGLGGLCLSRYHALTV